MICPNCGMEFKDGVITCTDCGTKLVHDLKEVQGEKIPLISLPAAYVSRLCAYLVYSGIAAEAVVNEENDKEKILMVSASQKELASKHVAVFLKEEPIEELPEVREDEEPENHTSFLSNYSLSSHTYKTAKTRYDEAVSTAFTFGGCSIGLIFVVLDQLITNFLPKGNLITILALIGMAIAMIFGSVKYFSISKNLKKEAEDEGYQQVSIRTWLENTPIQKLMKDAIADPLDSHFEAALIEREYFLLGVLKEQFPEIDQALLEYEAERYLDELEEVAEDEVESKTADTKE